MQINTLSDDYSVSPQIEVSDVPSIMQAGFKSVICNRPDQENPEPRQIEAIKAAVEAAGMEFAENVFDPSSFGPDKIERQAELLAQLAKPRLCLLRLGQSLQHCLGLCPSRAHRDRYHFGRHHPSRVSIGPSAATAGDAGA